MNKKIKYTDEPLGELKVISDLLPSPEELAFRDDTIIAASGTSANHIGLFVTGEPDSLDNIGNSGTLQIPILDDGSPSVTDLNQAFGAFDGAFGYESVDERLYVRESSTRWVFFNTDGAVT
ncbi:MAG: hypothetical protein IIB73_12080 [Proteobacteria bacterium]|nr:hypothetical protein [Pseudomonadota bacterium]